MTEVVRLALGLIKVAAEAKKDAGRLIIADANGRALKEIVFPGGFGSQPEPSETTSDEVEGKNRTHIVLPSPQQTSRLLNVGVFGNDAATAQIHIASTLSLDVIRKILDCPDELLRITPGQLEELVQDRLQAMGLDTERAGGVYEPDGGVDIVFWPKNRTTFPFLGAVQVKHHHSRTIKTGVDAVREMAGVLQRHGDINLGMVVTNTAFTSEAKWFVSPRQFFLRLRDADDISRWMGGDFSQEWRELPLVLQLGSNSEVQIRQP